MRFYLQYFFIFLLCTPFVLLAQQGASRKSRVKSSEANYQAYLFVYFTGNSKSEEAIRLAISQDGYHYSALNNNHPVISSEQISSTGGVRDPHILRGADGKTFYMVVTDMVSANGWNSNRAMVLLKSTDLVHWTSNVVNIQKRFTGNDSLLRVWAPQTIYDPQAKKYMIYFSMKHGKDPDKIYYAYANKDFTDLETEPKQLFFSPDNAACIDGDIINKDGRYYLFFKTEDKHPGIKIAVSDNLTGGYTLQSSEYVQQTQKPVEGAGTFKLNDGSGYILMYDMYTSGRYQFTKSTDLKNFQVIDEGVSMNFHPRHGTVLPITKAEADRLLKLWPSDKKVTASQSLNIFTLGDSNGTFPHSWPKQLQLALPDAQVFNISKSGRTIGFVNNGDSTLNSLLMVDENLKKAAEFTKDRPFDFIVLELGTNDAKAVFADRQKEVPANLERLIKKIKGCDYSTINKAKIVIISPPPYGTKAEATEKYAGGNNRVEQMSEAFKKVAKRYNCLFVNGYQTPGLDMNTMTEDGLHLDAAGSRKLIEPVVSLMVQSVNK